MTSPRETARAIGDRPVVFVGLPGVGKSSVGQAMATRLDRPFVDLDTDIERRCGKPVSEIFSAQGEAGFRDLEHDALTAALSRTDRPVVSAGGGVVTGRANRALMAAESLVVWLDVGVDALIDRLTGDETRPLLAGDPAGRLQALRRERLGQYSAVADVVVADSGRRTIEAMTDAAVASIDRLSETGEHYGELVDFGDERSYEVLVGRGAIDRLASVIPDGVGRVAIVTQDAVGVEVDPGIEHRVFVVDDGEEAKRLDVVGDLASRFARWGLTRRDAVISVGGGVVSDLAGFVAASYHRGVPVIHVSTTLLGQIDAAIGGKCGVNLPEGKNLVGAFKQPAAVICDTATLSSLPPSEFISGMGELAKYHFLGGGELDRLALAPRVAACVRIKADVVVEDEREGGRRAILNYGHTLAHALETVTNFELRHGEAVAIGLIYAAELAAALGRIDDARVLEHRRVAETYGLDVTLPEGVDRDELVDLFARDKKAIAGITFVLDGPSGIEPVVVEDSTLLRETLDAL